MNDKEYWKVLVYVVLKDRLYDIADEMECNVGEVLNRCLSYGIRHKDEWAKPKNELGL